jgi:pimeloyl-ACP methyl ester carboxylesterase
LQLLHHQQIRKFQDLFSGTFCFASYLCCCGVRFSIGDTNHQLRYTYNISLTSQVLEKRLKVDSFTLHSTYFPTNTPGQGRAVAVILHGAGQSDSTRHQRLAEHFIDKGVSIISLDFVGHGKTGGNVGDNNLAKRTLHALAVIKHWTDETTPLILCGFSMSGHTTLRLSALLGTRVKSLGLFCPAVYAAEAEEIHFGQPFTAIIRRPESWRSSLALQDAYDFRGRAAIIVGTEDESSQLT